MDSLIPTSDAHSSEYVGACDKRREWLSGFTGSAGVAVITLGPDEGAFMFVDCELPPAPYFLTHIPSELTRKCGGLLYSTISYPSYSRIGSDRLDSRKGWIGKC